MEAIPRSNFLLTMDIIEELKKEGLKITTPLPTEKELAGHRIITSKGTLQGKKVKIVIYLNDLQSFYNDCFSGDDSTSSYGASEISNWITIMGTHAYEAAWKVSESEVSSCSEITIVADKSGIYLEE